jgi:phage terminase small subunit
MRRGTKRKPSLILDLHGTRRARHKGRPPDAIAPGTLDAPPADLTDAERACWYHAIENAPAGLLGTIDTSLLRQWAVAEARFLAAREAQEKLDASDLSPFPMLVRTRDGALAPSPYVAIMTKTTLLLLRMIEQLGFSPSARVGLGQGDEKPADEDDLRWQRLEGMRRKAANS